jgi:long-chain acyl-CoA synthetase
LTLSDLLSERAKSHPRKLCIKFEHTKLSYEEVDHQVSLCAGGLNSQGLKRGERVAILMSNCPGYIIAYFSILRAGSIAVPINTFLTATEISYILKDAGCRILIYSNEYSSHVRDIKKGIPDILELTFQEIPGKQSDLPSGDDEETAVFLYTSGTTGFPKAAMLTHRNLLANVEACKKAMIVNSRDRIILFLPLFHSFCFTACVLLPIFAGASIILLRSVKPFSKIINSVIKDRVTFFVAIPAVYNILARKKIPFYVKPLFRLLIRIRACISGAASLPELTLRSFERQFNIPLIEGYGLTEASPVVAVNPRDGVRKAASVGLPLPGIEVAVFDENGRRLSVGDIGELAVKGPNVMRGYYNRQNETDEVMRDGWLLTGDMARIDGDGYIFIVDRKKDLIISDGMNIYPREIEEFIMQQGSVEECAMVGIPDGKGSETAVMFVKKKEDTILDEHELRNFMAGHLARFKMPRKIRFVQEFPKTATGKIKKAELRNYIL